MTCTNSMSLLKGNCLPSLLFFLLSLICKRNLITTQFYLAEEDNTKRIAESQCEGNLGPFTILRSKVPVPAAYLGLL